MKKGIALLVMLSILSCNNKTSENAKDLLDTSSNKEVTPLKPCNLFNADQLASVFNITDKSLIEMYARDEFRTNTNQCQFIWQEALGSVKGSQIMIDITHKYEDMGATFSRMLELKLLNGMNTQENNQIVTIIPTKLDGFNEHAYHWAQPSFQNVQKIAFQVRNDYNVEIMFNCHEGISVSQDAIKNKLIEIGKIIKENI